LKKVWYVFPGLLIIGAALLGIKFFLQTDNQGPDKLRESVIQKIYIDYNRKFTIPEGYPIKLIPIIDDSQIVASSIREDTEKNKYYSVTLTIDKPVDEVAGWYNLRLKNVKNLSTSNLDRFYSLKFSDLQHYYSLNIYPSVVNGQQKCLVSILVTPKLK
jgi:heme/copper-type cytochrome/quinol oxidase subunit 2